MIVSRLSHFIVTRGVLIALGLLVVLLAVGSPDRVSAQSQVLVSNIGQATSSTGHLGNDHAQAFTTGSNAAGYSLTSVEIALGDPGIGPPAKTVTIANDSNGSPGTTVGTLTNPASYVAGSNEFTHTGLDLAADTTYFLVVDITGTGTGGIRNTNSDAEDDGGSAGWNIGDSSLYRGRDTTGNWSTFAQSKKIRINGATKSTSTVSAPKVTGVTLDAEEAAGQVKVSWTQSTGATGYKVQWKSGAQEWVTTRQTTVASGTTLSATVTGLTGGTEYSFRVIATKSGAADSDPSDVATVTAPTAGPAAPTNVTVVPAGDGLLVTWTPSVSTDTVGYNIWWGADSARENRRWRPTGFFPNQFISGLTAGTTYKVRVSAWKSRDAAQGFSSEVTATPLASAAGTVTGVSASSTTAGQVDVSWTQVSGADGYEVYFTKLAIDRFWPWLYQSSGPKVVSGGTTTSASLTSADGIEAGEWYEVWVLATKSGSARSVPGDGQSGAGFTDGQGRRVQAAAATLASGAVRALPVRFTSDELLVSWPKVTGAVSYVVQWKTGMGSSYDTTNRANPTGASHRITGLTAGTDYDVKVTVIRTGSLASPDGEAVEASGATNPEMTGLSVVAPASYDDRIRATWSVLEGSTGFLVQWKLASESDYHLTTNQFSYNSTTTQFDRRDLLASTAYTVRVTRYHENAEGHRYLGDAQEATVTTNTLAANLVVAPVHESNTKLAVSWDAESQAQGYDIYWSKTTTFGLADCIPTNADNTDCSSAAVLATGTSHTLSGLDADTAYYVMVRPRHVDDTGRKFNGDSLTLESPVKTNGPLQGFTVAAVTGEHTKLAVNWTADPRATGYIVQWKKNGEAAYGSANRHVISGVGDAAPVSTYTITGLERITTYDVKVSVIVTGDADGPDGQSAEASAKTYTGLSGLTASAVGYTLRTDVSWNMFPSAVGFRVQWRTGDGSFNTGVNVTTLSHRLTNLAAGATYTVRVTARVQEGGATVDSEYDEVTFTTRNAYAMTVTAAPVAGTTDRIAVSWTPLDEPRVRSYLVIEQQVGQTYTLSTVVSSATTSHTVDQLSAGTAYRITVSANDRANGEGTEIFRSATQEVTTHAALTGLTVTPVSGKNTELSATWNAFTGAEQYLVQWQPANGQFNAGATVTTASHTITGLASGTAYTVRVTAVDTDPDPDNAVAVAQATASTTGPAGSAPKVTGVTVVTEDKAQQLKVSWAQSNGATGYKVQWKSGAEDWDASARQATVTGGNTLTTTVTGLTGGTEYSFRVIATKTGASDSDPSDVAKATALLAAPSAPTNVAANPVAQLVIPGPSGSKSRFLVTWTPSSDSAVTHYEIVYRIGDGAETRVPIRSGNLAEQIISTDQIISRTYSVKVAARKPNAAPGESSEVTVTTSTGRHPLPVTGVAASAATTNQDGRTLEGIRVNWNAVQNAASYRMYWAKLSGSPLSPEFIKNAPKSVSGATSATLRYGDNLEKNQQYRIWVVAVGSNGNYSALESGSTADVTSEPADALPSFAGASIGNQSYTQNATISPLQLPQASGGDGTLTYAITPALPTGLAFDPATRRLSGTPTATQGAQTYTYKVTDSDATNPDSAMLTFTITVNAFGQHHLVDDILVVNWTPSGEVGITGYLVQWKTSSQQYSTTERSHTAGPNASSYEVSGLALGVYTVKVTQQGGSDDGAAHEETVTLHGWPGVVYVDPVAGDARAIDVEWEEVSTAAGYVIQWKLASATGYPTANRATLAAADVQYRTFTQRVWSPTGYTDEQVSVPVHRISGLQPNAEYDAKVTVYTAAGSAADPDGLSHENSGTTHGELTGLTVAAVDGETTKLDVSWTAPVTSVARFKVRGYRVQWKTGSGNYDDTNSATVSTGTSHQITGLTANTAYTVRVTVLGNDSGIHEDGDADEASGTTNAAQGGESGNQEAPEGEGSATLTGLTVASVTDEPTKLAVSWHAVEGAVKYGVRWKTGSDGYGDAVETTGNSYTVTGLSAATTYTVNVAALDGDNTLLAEAAANGITAARTGGQQGASGDSAGPAALEGLTVSPVSGETTRLAVSWNAVTGADKYAVKWKTGSADYNSGTTVTTPSHTITGLTADTTYTVQVTAIDTGADPDAELAVGEASGTTNAAPAEDPPANTPASGAPTISGTPQVGQELTADTSGISDADGLANASYAYQWLADGSDISGATSGTYTPVAGDVGKAVKVRVSFTDDAGNAESLTSAATAAVAAADPPEEDAAGDEPAVSFVVYHDPDAGDEAVDRYNQGVKLLTDAGIAYSEVKGDVQEDVDRLAGVTDSVIPRFFLGDPTSADWVSKPRENNGGLRWLKEKVAELTGD